MTIRLQIGIRLCDRKQPLKRTTKLNLPCNARAQLITGLKSVRTRSNHRLECLAFMRRVASYGLDKIGNKVVSAFELDVDA